MTKIEEQLLAIQAVALSPENYFTWTSGIQSPIYCDNRLTISYPNVRNNIAEQLTTLIKTYYPDVEVIAGTSTAGIPHAAFVSEKMNLPMVYVRDSAKKHGKGNQIEGVIPTGKKVVVVEDLISTGISSLKVVEALKANQADVLGVVAIFSYELDKAKEAFKQADVSYHTAANYDTLIQVAIEQGVISEKHVADLMLWRNTL